MLLKKFYFHILKNNFEARKLNPHAVGRDTFQNVDDILKCIYFDILSTESNSGLKLKFLFPRSIINTIHICKLRHRKKSPPKFSKTHFSRTAY